MKLRKIFFSLACVVALGVPAANGDILAPGDYGAMSRTISLYEAGDYAGALDQLRGIDNRESEDAIFYTAMCKYHLGGCDAIDALNSYISRFPAGKYTTEAVYIIGNAYFYAGKYGEALTNYESVRRDAFDSENAADLNFRLGYSYMRLARFDEARACIDKIAGVKRYATASTFYYGYLHYVAGEYDSALDCFRGVKGDDLLEYNSQYYIAQIMYHSSDYDGVISLGKRLLSANKQSEFRHELLRIVGESLYNTGAADEAHTYLADYLGECAKCDITPMRSARYILGVIDYDNLRIDDAIENLRHATAGDDAMAQSAYLYLGECYVAKADHSSASMAFERAMKMPHDAATLETAFFNYAVAQSSGSRTPFSRTVDIFEDFVNQYPNSRYASEAGEYLCNAYITGNDYERALASINRIAKPSPDILRAKQYVLYNLAASRFSNGDISSATAQILEAVNLGDRGNGILAQCYLVLGNCRYAQGKFEAASSDYRKFLNLSTARTDNYPLGQYSLAYSQFKQKKYSDARTWFTRAISSGSLGVAMTADAQTRIGDTYYYGKDFASAETFYSRARSTSPATADYAMFQQAMMLGLQKKHSAKIELLDKLLADFPSSSIAPNAMLEKAQAQISAGNNDGAATTFRRLVSRYPSAPEARKGLLQLAITYKNMGDEKNAIATYKKVVSSYPASEEASLAVEDMKVIYSENGNIDDLQAFLASTPNAPRLDISEVDKLTFYAAEKAFLENNAGTHKIEEYLKRFPDGAYALQARFYIAKQHYADAQYDTALAQLNEVLAAGADASFAEDALAMKADILMRQGHATNAMLTYQELAKRATTADNRLAAQLGILRAANDLARYPEVIAAAGEVLANSTASADEEMEARFLRANALRNTGKGSAAVEDWSKLATDPQSLYGAKSAFYLAEYYFDNDKMSKAEKTLNAFIDEGTPHNYWLARAFILLSDIYAKKGDNFAAREYLESLKSNYPGKEPDIFEMIEQRLRKLNKK